MLYIMTDTRYDVQIYRYTVVVKLLSAECQVRSGRSVTKFIIMSLPSVGLQTPARILGGRILLAGEQSVAY
jgi:hypothetical protein